MFHNLEAEMARKKITQYKLAEILGVTPTTLSFKLNGRSTLSLNIILHHSSSYTGNLPVEQSRAAGEDKSSYGIQAG